MRLGQVIANAAQLERGSPELEIQSIACDSRRVTPGALFCALGGVKEEGTRFVAEALSRGAVAVLAERAIPGDFPLATSLAPRRAMALCACNFHGWPAAELVMLGVTGTNGKTTVACLTEQMVRTAGRRTGLVGTVEQRFPGVVRPSAYTTPESIDLQSLLAEMVAAGTEIVAMEVSSHALQQGRVDGIRYRGAAFTQLTRDHLDFHYTMEDYFAAKKILFDDHLAQAGVAVVGSEDEWSDRIAAGITGGQTLWRYAVDRGDLHVRGLQVSLAGFEGDLVTPAGTRRVSSPLVGRHNVLNALAATGLALAAGIPLNAILEALAATHGAPGRLEVVPDPAGRRIFVDYAHTDDALARVLDTLRTLCPKGSRLIVAFGCGGDRDRGKRPLMGEVAVRRADVAVVTSDNPRTEDPEAIIADIVPGCERGGARRITTQDARSSRGYVVIPDRAEAIADALRIARPGDTVLIAGKGHEDYQIIGTTKHPFDDRSVARAALAGVPA